MNGLGLSESGTVSLAATCEVPLRTFPTPGRSAIARSDGRNTSEREVCDEDDCRLCCSARKGDICVLYFEGRVCVSALHRFSNCVTIWWVQPLPCHFWTFCLAECDPQLFKEVASLSPCSVPKGCCYPWTGDPLSSMRTQYTVYLFFRRAPARGDSNVQKHCNGCSAPETFGCSQTTHRGPDCTQQAQNRYEHVRACLVSFFDAVSDENHVHHESSPGHNRLERSAVRAHETVGNTQTSHRRTTQATATRRHAERGTSSNAREASCVKHTHKRPLHAPHFCIRKLHGFEHSCGAGLADVPAVAPRLTCWHVVQENRRQYSCWTMLT